VEEIMNESLLVVTTVLKNYFLGWDLNWETVTDEKRFFLNNLSTDQSKE
jgi:hypothetical protein